MGMKNAMLLTEEGKAKYYAYQKKYREERMRTARVFLNRVKDEEMVNFLDSMTKQEEVAFIKEALQLLKRVKEDKAFVLDLEEVGL